ncbi:hypothetical protein [Nesterenkonia sp.]|uniref:hypothetical protein n=1 Tax=Nesterenkonia sp. TaxID=704201 RepID=UPI00263397EF|nr:hypothetical protein [Nesterenkonia sp.]
MKFAPAQARRAAAGLMLIAGLAATGCSAINYQATTHQYSASDGAMVEAEDVKLRHLMFVAGEEGGPARMLGLVSNTGRGEAEVQLSVEGETFDFQLEPGEAVNLQHDGEHIVSAIGAAPGSMQEVTATVTVTGEDGSSETAEETFDATIVDGAIAEYRDLLPEGFDESMAEHLEHGPDTYGGGAAHHDPHDTGH